MSDRTQHVVRDWDLDEHVFNPLGKQFPNLCWLDTAADLLESCFYIENRDTNPNFKIRISKQYILDRINPNAPLYGGFGYSVKKTLHWVKNYGVIEEKDYGVPYTGEKGDEFEDARLVPDDVAKLKIRDIIEIPGDAEPEIVVAVGGRPVGGFMYGVESQVEEIREDYTTPYVIRDRPDHLSGGFMGHYVCLTSAPATIPVYRARDPFRTAGDGRITIKRVSGLLEGEFNPIKTVVYPVGCYFE